MGRVKVNLNITPLIDVVFLLLIFFILTYQAVNNKGIKLTLPVASTATHQEDTNIIVYISSDNEIIIDDTVVLLVDLAGELTRLLSDGSKRNVVIKADEKIDLGLAVQVMDAAKKANANGLVISTKSNIEN